MIILARKDLDELFKAEIAVNSVREAFKLHYEKKINQPQRLVMSVKGNWWGLMPSSTDYSFVTKIVNVIPENKERGLLSVQGVVILMSPDSGEVLAIIDGTTLTAIRTAAASVLSTEIAINGRNIGNLGIIGAGTEAYYHAKLALEYFKVQKIYISARKSHFELARKIGGEATDLETLLKNSDIIFATTSSNVPVVLGKYLKDIFHVSSIGAHTPDSREIDDDTIVKVKSYIVDSLEAVSKESGDYIIPKQRGLLENKMIKELGEIIDKGIKVERPSLFKTVGIAAEDNVTAHIAYEEASKRGIGVNVSI
ncbi:Ornithine cyclodeaminase [Saccharolobus shibatae B12]|uniref:Ornithine cyclodeaminase n=1 Tax=Saccharolobus shibatae (strain ATCC 51178 / DSM 5389 / JCM 8931 / NBRC 15437 / B12) TaxID=523848 RepID=A0A8F5GV86_SACSH|nr:ornithine cyclodeaminase family protein [Saccharolobus shibatae]QXJ30167.1 Ornithine cyclodeaminase [Saccharolobus shibatae B12]